MTAMEWKAKFDERWEGWHIVAVGDTLGFTGDYCHTCDAPPPGDRYRAVMQPHDAGIDPNGEWEGEEWNDLDVCHDCLLYVANGDLPVHLDD